MQISVQFVSQAMEYRPLSRLCVDAIICALSVLCLFSGRERSRDPKSIVAEAQDLFDKGYREVTLLGQN